MESRTRTMERIADDLEKSPFGEVEKNLRANLDKPALSQEEVSALLGSIEGRDDESYFDMPYFPDETLVTEYYQAINLIKDAIADNCADSICLDLVKMAKNRYRAAVDDGNINFDVRGDW